ncbi:uncharacterized protein LOC124418175 [Gallus gallus]|uniref:uncharacterized protein LOC124418175 n=1 Tax=Gallus gallus TaxID=9031 RepID=UPI001F01EFAF|nr:uncharacterized protein LOC124418175 [Gallus gallus]
MRQCPLRAGCRRSLRGREPSGRWVIGERRYAPPPEGCREEKRDGALLAACERQSPAARGSRRPVPSQRMDGPAGRPAGGASGPFSVFRRRDSCVLPGFASPPRSFASLGCRAEGKLSSRKGRLVQAAPRSVSAASGSLPLFQMLLFPFQAKAKGTAPRPAVAKCARGCCASCCAFAFLLRSSSGSERVRGIAQVGKDLKDDRQVLSHCSSRQFEGDELQPALLAAGCEAGGPEARSLARRCHRNESFLSVFPLERDLRVLL